jgi:hypothetical protein
LRKGESAAVATVFKPKFRNLGIVLVLVVVLVLGALAFCAGKDPHLSCNFFVPLARKTFGFSRTRTTPQLRSLIKLKSRPGNSTLHGVQEKIRHNALRSAFGTYSVFFLHSVTR